MSDNWNTYFTFIDNKPASFLLDMEPWSHGESETFVHLYQLSVALKEPNEDGLTSQKEASVLYEIEDSIHDSLEGNYKFVGRVTIDGRREFYYYTDSADGDGLKHAADNALIDYTYTVNRIEEQKPGEFYYEFLYPNESERHRMANRPLVDKLIELGDKLEKSRVVNHWIYFGSVEACDRFVENVQKDGFHLEERVKQEDNTYSARVSRNDFVELHAINEVTDYLVAAAQQWQGEYDGWETKVIKEQESFLKRIFKSKK
ncbi:DUF695 domain-containing protein [Paenibacillus sp. PR3]|uniref:DUF695 domain-containing protein n=1 Tax=Paenibacillus terricola TaxID=2763503 RepID=A0ABR8N498_9BACL|nr:DUF695 domain-containing protein [Paenibacillus terricola]MBD3922035.1 DUF695 domain-containing protein [Paenibacillus terricola]